VCVCVCLSVCVGELSCCDRGETESCRQSCRQTLSSHHLSEQDVVTRISEHCGHVHYAVSTTLTTSHTNHAIPSTLIISRPVEVQSIVIGVSVCLSYCLFVCLSAGIYQNTCPNFSKFYVNATRGRGSSIL